MQEVKRLRKKYGINQKELALRANVSQSLIAKIESGTVEPTYGNARSIFAALEELREKEELKAKQIMKTKIMSCSPSESVKDVLRHMKAKGISQMPVLDGANICGIISEKAVLNHVIEKPEKLKVLKVEDVMEETPPIVSPDTGQKLLLELLKDYPVVLVAEKGHLKGIVSKSDVLERIE